MFHVTNRDALAIPRELLPPGTAVVTGVEITMQMAMFLAEYVFIHETEGPLTTKYLAFGLEKLVNPSLRFGKATLERVMLLSPPHLNGTSEWKTDVLAWMDEAEDPEGCFVELYGLSDGRVLWQNPEALSLASLKNRRRLFTAPHKH